MTATPDEAWLIQQAQEGRRTAFARLVDHYWDRLYRWLFHLCHDRHDAEDLAQETFLKALEALPHYRPQGAFASWLFRIAYHAFLNRRRQRRRVRLVLPADLPAPAPGPAEEALRREEWQRLLQAVGRLPTAYRAAFLLRVEQGLSFAQIAEVLEVPEATVRWRVFKARQKLLSLLAPLLEGKKS